MTVNYDPSEPFSPRLVQAECYIQLKSIRISLLLEPVWFIYGYSRQFEEFKFEVISIIDSGLSAPYNSVDAGLEAHFAAKDFIDKRWF